MFSSLLRPKRGRRRSSARPLLFTGFQAFRNTTPSAEDTASEEHEDSDENGDDDDEYDDADGYDDDSEGEQNAAQPILPIFSAPVLDKIPIYHLQHSIRLLVMQKCETTLSWDQLRSPQVSQFLVKPIQQKIRDSHLNRGTLYALLANCLQFQKDGQMNPGSIGVFRTRAVLCELLAMRMLRDSNTRELIDALFYDFDPMQGVAPAPGTATPRSRQHARISAVEIAIRAQAKRFLAHPLVVQQLEAIWAGAIVFHSAADTLHRRPPQGAPFATDYGTLRSPESARTITPSQPQKWHVEQLGPPLVRRSVSLYDPSDASPFKLSRLRVPRYRQLFSTLSYAIMLGLFLAVLIEHSLYITPLEIVFWFWSAGYMLDELVGFTEQGFGLYILSVWNAFDIGILLMFLFYYGCRLYGLVSGKHHTASLAYDVLASTAVLLFPRLFSVLDHYRYFSQLMIAFRMMALDLFAILILIVIACSGFFVAFTLAFPVNLTPGETAYALFQLLMGFTPAAWEIWDGYNLLGKAILTLFLIICHFLIVTILITVLTNSFMAVVQNANEEHQFVFAVNTMSMVKSDALFSYIAPANVIGWLLTPLRYIMPFRQYVKLNRTVIKVTHMPLLLAICVYERLVLSRRTFEPLDLVEQRGRHKSRVPAAFAIAKDAELFSPGARLREPSVTTFRKDRALEEVFRRPFKGTTARIEEEQAKSTTVVQDWMRAMGEGGAGSPVEEPRDVLDKLETRRPTFRRHRTAQGLYAHRHGSGMAPSAVSDPEDARTLPVRVFDAFRHTSAASASMDELPQQTDEDAGDEMASNEDDEHRSDDEPSNRNEPLAATTRHLKQGESRSDLDKDDYFRTPTASKSQTPMFHTAATQQRPRSPPSEESPSRPRTAQRRTHKHSRNASSATILYSPLNTDVDSRAKTPPKPGSPTKRKPNAGHGGTGMRSGTVTPSGRRAAPTLQPLASVTNPASKPRAILPPRDDRESNHNLASFLAINSGRREPSFNARALDLASDLGDNRAGPSVNILEALPASFGTQMEMSMRRHQQHHGVGDGDGDTARRLNKLVLARMSTLEQGFAEVLREVKGLSRGASTRGNSSVEGDSKSKSKRKTQADKSERHRPKSMVESTSRADDAAGPDASAQNADHAPTSPSGSLKLDS
ncbi:uncharacterized protein PV09_08783 [Verruconis gallopava]|uniref:Uncharacterized protein n=1 Tax=Verruconis gallopava TaxID=253628 RepID=A0A0D2AKS0_9PEZI|nr:uncharacterized protein PV09_08783 [Verruconis gallopava]KIV99608.1 hypothetical protein PV09_08783 [Verruconis gallopava]